LLALLLVRLRILRLLALRGILSPLSVLALLLAPSATPTTTTATTAAITASRLTRGLTLGLRSRVGSFGLWGGTTVANLRLRRDDIIGASAVTRSGLNSLVRTVAPVSGVAGGWSLTVGRVTLSRCCVARVALTSA